MPSSRHEERLRDAVDATQRVRPPADAIHAVPHRGRRLDHRAGRTRGVHVLVGLSARRGRPAPDRTVRGQLGQHIERRATSAFYHDNFVDLMGAGLGALQLTNPSGASPASIGSPSR